MSFVLEPVPDGTRLTIQEQQVAPGPTAGRAEARPGALTAGRTVAGLGRPLERRLGRPAGPGAPRWSPGPRSAPE